MGTGKLGETEPASDLFDRWLSHREQQAGETLGDEPTTPAVAPSRAESDHADTDHADTDQTATDHAEPETEAAPRVDHAERSVADEPDQASPPPTCAGSTEVGRSIVEALRQPVEPVPVVPPAARPARTTRTPESRPKPDVAGAMLAAVRDTTVAEPAKSPTRRPRTAAIKVAEAKVPVSTGAVTKVAEVAADPVTRSPAPKAAASEAIGRVSTNVEFAPRNGTLRLVGLLMLVALGATGIAGYVAYQDQSPVNVGITATLGVLTLIIYAVRAGSSIAHLSVTRGQLEIVRGGGRNVFDLSSHYTPIEVIGQPGERGWKVLFVRRSMSPFVIDASMVDPTDFMKVLRDYRPE